MPTPPDARVALVSRRLADQQTRLADQQQPLLALTASLQQLSRRPPVSVLAQPGSLGDMVHARAVLDAVMPVIQERTAGVRQELARLRTTQRVEDVHAFPGHIACDAASRTLRRAD